MTSKYYFTVSNALSTLMLLVAGIHSVGKVYEVAGVTMAAFWCTGVLFLVSLMFFNLAEAEARWRQPNVKKK